MARYQLDFTLTFRRLADLAGPAESASGTTVEDLFEIPDPLLPWLARWREALTVTAAAIDRDRYLVAESEAAPPILINGSKASPQTPEPRLGTLFLLSLLP